MSRRKKTKGSTFGKTLRSLLDEKGITLRDAAKIAGVSASTIDDWCAGSTPADYLAVSRLANQLGVNFEFLLTGRAPKSQSVLSSVAEVFEDGGALFDGYAKITIQRLVPRGTK